MRKSLCLVFLFFITTYFAISVLAQGSTTGAITGSVVDSQGSTLAGATISAKNINTNAERTTQIEEDGSYSFIQLPPGDYVVTVTVDGFKPEARNFTVLIGTTAVTRFVLVPEGTTEVIEIRATTTTLNETRTESSTNIDSQSIANLPINQRNFLDFSLTSSRVTADRVPTQGVAANSGLSFNGQPARNNNITIDGLDNNESASGSVRSTFSQEAIQEFQILADSFSAEFGRASAGIVNIVTKTGTNDTHGSLFFFNRNDGINTRDVFTSFKPNFDQYQFGATLGGPVKKDKIFYFTSFERLSIKQNNFVTIADQTVKSANSLGLALQNGPIPFSIGNTALLARSDIRLSNTDSVKVRYNGGFTYNGALELFGGLVGQTNSGVQKLEDNSIAISNTYINVGLNLVNETRFLYNRRTQDVLATDVGPQVRLIAPEGADIFGRGTFLTQNRKSRLYQIANITSISKGKNQIKFGLDYVFLEFNPNASNVPISPGGFAQFSPIDFGFLGGPSFSGLETFDPNLRSPQQLAFLQVFAAGLSQQGFPLLPLDKLALPVAFAQGFGDSRSGGTSKFFSLFFQDDIKVHPSLIIKAGVRYDLNRVRLQAKNNGNFSPRLSFSYRPTKISKLNIHAAYGLFFSVPFLGPTIPVDSTTSKKFTIALAVFPFSVIPFSLPGHKFPDGNTVPAALNLGPQFTQILTFQPDQRASYTQQANFGLDYFFNGQTSLSLQYTYVRGLKIFSARNINPVVRPVANDPVASFLTGRVNPNQGDNFEFENAFDSYFNGFTVTFNQRFKNRFSLLASYTFSKAIDNFIDFRIESGLLELVDSFKLRDERSLSLQDTRSRFVLSGGVDLSYRQNRILKGFQLSTIITLNSGRPYNLLAGIDLNQSGDNPPGDRPFANGTSIGRNLGITPGFANIDLRLSRKFVIKEKYKLEGTFEAFNLFNRVNISDFSRSFPPDAQGNFNLPPQDNGRFIVTPDRFRGAFPSRQLQLGFRISF
ncbi:MAG: ferrienterochelin and colicins outer membrane receptor [bacterium]|nr:MAG: ferrienterochelin and colicins outer membrane receptor [bacterium]